MFQQDNLLLNIGGWMSLPFRMWQVLPMHAEGGQSTQLVCPLNFMCFDQGMKMRYLDVSVLLEESFCVLWPLAQHIQRVGLFPRSGGSSGNPTTAEQQGQTQPASISWWARRAAETTQVCAPGCRSSAALNRPAEPRSLHQSRAILQS